MLFRSTTATAQKLEPDNIGQIHIQLERILNHSLFRNGQRCQALFRHVTERALAGESDALKERALGVDVFGRPPNYDTNADPIVRGTAAEIRKKLAQYYQDATHQGELKIELHAGSYVPEFHAPVLPAERPVHRSTKRLLFISTIVFALVAAPTAFLVTRIKHTDLDRFWKPMLTSPSGVLFSVGESRVYSFRSDVRQSEIEAEALRTTPVDLSSAEERIPLRELVPVWNRYIALGDADCLLRLASLFEKRGIPYRIRSEAATTFSDLRERPAIFIGAFDNAWTLRAVGDMRYSFYKDFHGLEVVRDRDHPERTDWKLINSWPYWDIPKDYAIISRVLDRTTDRTVVIAAGITHFGTAGAGEFLSNPQYFAEVVPRLPSNWATKNLQIVLAVPVVQGASGHPRVLATHVW